MSTEATMEEAIQAWQQKHRISDHDPALAIVELLGIRLRFVTLMPPESLKVPNYEDFRATVEKLQTQATTFLNEATILREQIGFAHQQLKTIRHAALWELAVIIFLSGWIGCLLCFFSI